jgi:hypothetical protein
LPLAHGAVCGDVKLNGLFVISGLRGLIFTANSPSSVSVSSLTTCPPAIASIELILLVFRECPFTEILGCLEDPPWNCEKDETAISPRSGDIGWELSKPGSPTSISG